MSWKEFRVSRRRNAKTKAREKKDDREASGATEIDRVVSVVSSLDNCYCTFHCSYISIHQAQSIFKFFSPQERKVSLYLCIFVFRFIAYVSFYTPRRILEDRRKRSLPCFRVRTFDKYIGSSHDNVTSRCGRTRRKGNAKWYRLKIQ